MVQLNRSKIYVALGVMLVWLLVMWKSYQPLQIEEQRLSALSEIQQMTLAHTVPANLVDFFQKLSLSGVMESKEADNLSVPFDAVQFANMQVELLAIYTDNSRQHTALLRVKTKDSGSDYYRISIQAPKAGLSLCAIDSGSVCLTDGITKHKLKLFFSSSSDKVKNTDETASESIH